MPVVLATPVGDDDVTTLCNNCYLCSEGADDDDDEVVVVCVDVPIGGSGETVPAKRLTGVAIIPDDVIPDGYRR